jgi:hypothetical protein
MIAEWDAARAAVAFVDDDEEVELPRYQIQVHLVDDRSVP